MAVKIIRQQKKIALLGSATSASALRGGQERAPEVLVAAGLVARLNTAGLEVSELGNTAKYTPQPDVEHPRAKNVSEILKSLNDLRPRVELAVKSGALPLILSGDSISVLAIIAAARRYFRSVGLIYIGRDAGLHVPATTTSGSIDGMVISHIIGRGAPELVRFWGEPPLIREADIALFGLARLDPPEERYLESSLLRRHLASEVSGAGGANAARLTLERVHAAKHQFVLHLDLNVINDEEFPWTNSPGSGGLTLHEVRDALRVFVSQPNLAAVEVAGYNPELDLEGQGARLLIDLLVSVLAVRLESDSSDIAAEPILPAAMSLAAPSGATRLASEPPNDGEQELRGEKDPDPISS